jgi:DNA-binding transcriptional MerR regulator
MTEPKERLATGSEVDVYLAKEFHVHPRTIGRWMREGDWGPQPCTHTPGGQRRYKWDDVRAFAALRTRSVQAHADETPA